MNPLARTRAFRAGLVALGLLFAGCTPHAPVDSAPVTFVVTVPANTPADSHIWVSGDQEAIGTWNGAGVELAPQADGTYAGTADFAPGTTIQWKVTRGDWDTVEKGPTGEEIDNHTYTVKLHDNTARTTVATWADLTPENVQHTLSGNVQFHRAFGTGTFVKPRDLIVYLPPGYDANPTRRYPVLYMHDGQNLMDAATSFSRVEWGVDETAERLIANGTMEPIIIVGVNNTSDRFAEYTPVMDPNYSQYGGGNADNYGRFLTQEVKPFIDQTYRTLPDAKYTGVAGSSLGGLVSMYFGLTLHDTFTRIGVVSPTVFWGNYDIVTRVNKVLSKPPLRIWEDIGTAESGTESTDDARKLRDALTAKGFVLGDDLRYLEVPQATHSETAWAARVDQILQYLYPPQPAP